MSPSCTFTLIPVQLQLKATLWYSISSQNMAVGSYTCCMCRIESYYFIPLVSIFTLSMRCHWSLLSWGLSWCAVSAKRIVGQNSQKSMLACILHPAKYILHSEYHILGYAASFYDILNSMTVKISERTLGLVDNWSWSALPMVINTLCFLWLLFDCRQWHLNPLAIRTRQLNTF